MNSSISEKQRQMFIWSIWCIDHPHNVHKPHVHKNKLKEARGIPQPALGAWLTTFHISINNHSFLKANQDQEEEAWHLQWMQTAADTVFEKERSASIIHVQLGDG